MSVPATASSVTSRGDEGPSATVPRDHLYPALHVRPERGWINDPCGPIHWRGEYHLFYQHNPAEPRWGRIQWGHAVSADLVHWEHRPPALVPAPGGPDEAGCWSGSAIATDEGLTLVYTGVREDRSGRQAYVQTLCVASSADGTTWVRDPANPILRAPERARDFRDPFVWREDGRSHMLVGAGTPATGGQVLHYSGPDLGHLEPAEELFTERGWATPAWVRGSAWECPQLVAVGPERVVLVAVCDTDGPRQEAVIRGPYRRGRLSPHEVGHFDLGPDFCAAATMRAPDGRTLCWGWSWEARSEEAQLAAGWAGVLTFPRVLGDDGAGHLTIRPAAELGTLRGEQLDVEGCDVTGTMFLDGVDGTRLELRASFEHPEVPAGVAVRGAPDGSEVTLLYVDPAAGEFVVDRTRSSRDASARRDVTRRPIDLRNGGPLDITVFVDGSLVETFINGRAAATARTYPTNRWYNLVGFYADGRARLHGATAWNLRSDPAVVR